MISSLVYTSRSLLDEKTPEFAAQIDQIRKSSERQNTLKGITGFLIYYDGMFVQMLEGDFDDITSTYSRVRQDKRHEACKIVYFAEVENRCFNQWSMENSMSYIETHQSQLTVKLKFMERFLSDTRQYPITIRDLLVAIAEEIQKMKDFPRPRMVA